MPPSLLTDVDGIAVVAGALLDDAATLAEIDGDTTRLRGDVIAPFPRYQIEGSVSYDLQTQWIVSWDVRLSAYGAKEGDPGDAALMRMLGVALVPVVSLPLRAYGPGEPVVTNVAMYLPMQRLPEPGGRGRWQVGVRLAMHPPAVSLAP